MTKGKKNISAFMDYVPTREQQLALEAVQHFVDEGNNQDFLIIQGSAGTGKSTLIKAVTQYLNEQEVMYYLAAPTGRAAKVVQSKAQVWAKTIHGLIYKPEKLKNGQGIRFVRKQVKNTGYSVFIIDEASMISDTLHNSEQFVATKPLLTDLLEFIKESHPMNKVLFIGDQYQLAPIHSNNSPALSLNYLQAEKGLKGSMVALREVKRQGADSMVLRNAVKIREAIELGLGYPQIELNVLDSRSHAVDLLCDRYDENDIGRVAAIAWTNGNVNTINKDFRKAYGYSSQKLQPKENVMLLNSVFLNNSALMKGENVRIIELDNRVETYAGLHFQDARIEFVNGNGDLVKASTKVLLDTLDNSNGSLSAVQENLLHHESIKRNKKFRESQLPGDDAYVGALRPRYCYAVTCHKAQGGEWEDVILDPYIPNNDLRWLYTAITRASKNIYSHA